MVAVACGWRHTISVSSSGSLYTYGWSKYGQLGHGDFEDHLVPHQLEALRNNVVTKVSTIFNHSRNDVCVFVCIFFFFFCSAFLANSFLCHKDVKSC